MKMEDLIDRLQDTTDVGEEADSRSVGALWSNLTNLVAGLGMILLSIFGSFML